MWEESGVFDSFYDWLVETASGFSEADSDLSIPYGDYMNSHGDSFRDSAEGFAFALSASRRLFRECTECQVRWSREWDALVHTIVPDLQHSKVVRDDPSIQTFLADHALKILDCDCRTDDDEYIFDGQPAVHLVPLAFASAGATTCTSLDKVGLNARVPFHKTLTMFCMDRHIRICGWTRVFPVTFDDEGEEIDMWEEDSSIGEPVGDTAYEGTEAATSKPLQGFCSARDVISQV